MVTPYFPPIINGPSLHVYHLVKGLTAQKVHVQVHTIAQRLEEGKHNYFNINGLNIVSFPSGFDLRGSRDQPISFSYILSTIRKSINFDVVHVHDFPKICNDFLIITLNKLRSKIPIVFTPHGAGEPSPANKLSSRIYWSLGIPRKVLRNVDRIVVVSSLQAELFAKLCDVNKLSLIEEGISPDYFVNKPTFIDDTKLRILFIGRIIKEKGIEHLLYALHKAIQIIGRNKIELVCIGPDYGYLKEALKIIDDLSLKANVNMVGSVSEKTKIRYLSWCDLLVLPSFYEAFGLPIVEAMAQGKPVIASGTVGAKSLIKHGETGFLVKIGDSKDLADAILKFVDNPQLKYEMGAKALKYASKFRMDNMIEAHLQLYKSVCSHF